MPRRIARAWRALTDPPHQKPIYLAMYLIAFSGGLWALTQPPRTVEGEWGPALTAIWAGLLVAGGILGTATVTTRYWWAERAALILLTTVWAMYLSFQLMSHFTTEGSRAFSVTFLCFALLPVILRWVSIRGWDYAPPEKE